MTQSAPMDRTMSKFVVLHTPVTFAANDFAICTANVPTPPAAPLIKTFCPCRIRPLSRRRSEEHTSELQSRFDLVCRLLLEKKKIITNILSLINRRLSIKFYQLKQ